MWAQRTLIFIYCKCYITVFDKVLSIHLWCFLFILGVFLNLFTSKIPYFLCKYVLFIYLFTTLKYHSNTFLKLKPKDEVTLLLPNVLFWLILECSKLVFPIDFYGCPFLTQLQEGVKKNVFVFRR